MPSGKKVISGFRKEFMFIKSEYKLIRINLDDILFLSGLRDYTQIYLKGRSSPLTTLQNLKEFGKPRKRDEMFRLNN